MDTDIRPADTARSSNPSMIMRILAFVLGTPILLLGLLATYVAVDMMLNPAPGKQHPLAVSIIGIAIMAVPVVVGAILLKVSLLPKKRSQQLKQPTTSQRQDPRPRQPSASISREVHPTEAQTEEQPTCHTLEEVEVVRPTRPESAVAVLSPATRSVLPEVQPTKQAEKQPTCHALEEVGTVRPTRPEPAVAVLSPATREVEARLESAGAFRSPATCGERAGATGQLLAECGPKKSGQTHYIVIGFLMIVFGCVTMAIPETIVPPKKPADAAMIRTAGLCLGGVITLFGFGMMAGPLFGPAQRVRLYDNKLIEEKGNQTREISFDQIASVQIQEWYEHRFAPQTFNVKVQVIGQPDLAFSSALVGDSERIIRFLTEHTSDVQVTDFAELA